MLCLVVDELDRLEVPRPAARPNRYRGGRVKSGKLGPKRREAMLLAVPLVTPSVTYLVLDLHSGEPFHPVQPVIGGVCVTVGAWIGLRMRQRKEGRRP